MRRMEVEGPEGEYDVDAKVEPRRARVFVWVVHFS